MIVIVVCGLAWLINRERQGLPWPWEDPAIIAAEACDQARTIAKASPEVKAALGEPINRAGRILGSAKETGNSAFAEWSEDVFGPKGMGMIYAVANRVGERWIFSRLVFSPPSNGADIDLTPAPERERLLPPAHARVYLVPLDLPANYSLDWAPEYYKARLGIEVKVLPPIPLDDWVTEASRHQAVAERITAVMAQAEKEISRDPSAILIGITNRDMFIGAQDWKFVVNYRADGRRGIVSLARLSLIPEPTGRLRVLLESRLRKILTKNILILAFDLPLSNDPTSILCLTMNPGPDLDLMSESIIGASGTWSPTSADATVTVAAAVDEPESWGIYKASLPPGDLTSEVFETDMEVGLFIQRRTDFFDPGWPPFQFVRVFRTKDNASRTFGVGANDSLDIFLVGQMGNWIDLTNEGGSRIHFKRDLNKVGALQLYRSDEGTEAFFNPRLEYDADVWHLRTSDGWDYVFPYESSWPGTKVTVLTGYSDSSGGHYAMTRDSRGNLLSLKTPSGYALTFACDSAGRYQKIVDSRGRWVGYTYDSKGRLSRFVDSGGNAETYTYDDGNDLLLVIDGTGRQILKNEYDGDDVVEQTLSDGRQLKYRYSRRPDNSLAQSFFTDPSGFTTTFNFAKDDITQSLPRATTQ